MQTNQTNNAAVADREKALESALDFAVGAINDAIYSEDGFDGAAGERVLQIIAEAKHYGTFDVNPVSRGEMLRILGLASTEEETS